MFNIRNVATSGFDRAIVAMRREHGGREASDSDWKRVELYDNGVFKTTFCEFVIGADDAEEIMSLIKLGRRDFMQFIVVWMHFEADERWWVAHHGHFIAKSDVSRRGDRVTKSVMTTYAELRKLAELMYPGKDQSWQEFNALCEVLGDLPECWMIIPKVEKMEG